MATEANQREETSDSSTCRPTPAILDISTALFTPGSLTCKEMIRYQCGPLAAALGKAGPVAKHAASVNRTRGLGQDTAEWTFAEGTVQHPWEVSAHLSDFEKALAGKRVLTEVL